MVAQANHKRSFLKSFREFIKGAILVGHYRDSQFNKRGFDVARVYGPIANALFGDETWSTLKNSVDTLPLLQNMIAGVSHKNEDLCARFGITLVAPTVHLTFVNALAFSKCCQFCRRNWQKNCWNMNSKIEQVSRTTHVQPRCSCEDNKLESWIEFGVKLDKKHLQLPGRNKF